MAAARQPNNRSEGDFSEKVDRLRDNVKNFTASTSESAADSVNRLVDQGADKVKVLADAVPDVSVWADDQLDAYRDRVRAEPLKMMAIAAGVGALFGMFFLRR